MANNERRKLTDKDVVNLVHNEFENAMGAPGGDVARERELALKYYMRAPFGNEEEGISKAVTSDVMEVIDGYMPPLMRLFSTQDNLLTFDGFSQADEAAANQESDYVSYNFFKKNPAFEILFFWCFDSLLQKNGYVKCYWDDAERITTERYRGLTDDELLQLMGDDELEPIEREERTERLTDPQTGQQVDLTVHDVLFRRVTKRGYARVDNVPPDEFRISSDANRTDPGSARMVGHERYVTRDELLAMGFDRDKVAKLNSESPSIKSGEEQARKNRSDDQKITSSESIDWSQEKILLREAYIKIDMDGDGRAELKQVYTAGGEMLSIEDADRQPFHCLPSSPIPHKHFGLSSSEKVMDSQLINSTLLRQILDNLYHTNNPGHIVWEQAMTDGTANALLTRKVGTMTTVSRPVNEAIGQDVVPFTAAASFPMMEYFDKKMRDRTGVASDSESLTPDSLKHIQQSVLMQVFDTAKAKIELVARIFAETGLKTLFLHMHELLQKHQNKEEVVKLRGQYVAVRPDEWRTRYDMTVNIGLGIGSREQNLLHLDAIWQKQREMVEGGGLNLTVTPDNLYNTARDIVRNGINKEPGLYFTDPQGKPAPPVPTAEQQLREREAAIKEREQKLDMERQQNKAVENQLKAQKQQIDAQLDVMNLREKSQAREDKLLTEIESLKNEVQQMQLDKIAADADRSLDELVKTAQSDLSRAQAMLARANTAKVVAETEAQEVETAAAESGVTSLLESDGESSKSE